jgi:3-oxoacyl-[acyl-carrier-protein] synthase-3
MEVKHIGIIGTGAYLPEGVITNADLEKMVDTSDEWITTRTGIKERRIAGKGVATSDLAVNAARQALSNAKLPVELLELIIVATITPDMQFPSVSCLLQDKIGAKNAVCFDIAAACSGFIYGISIARGLVVTGTYRNVLVVGVEMLSSIVDWTDRNTCVLFGDGAGAAVVSEVSDGGIISVYLGADGGLADLLKVPAGGSRMPSTHKTVDERLHYLKMNGNETFKFAVKLMSDAVLKVLSQCGLKSSDIDCLIPHQANGRIIESVAKRVGVPRTKVYLNIEKYGNMSSASTAVALYEAQKEGRIKKGDTVVLVAFGSGLTWGACVIKW